MTKPSWAKAGLAASSRAASGAFSFLIEVVSYVCGFLGLLSALVSDQKLAAQLFQTGGRGVTFFGEELVTVSSPEVHET